MGEKLNGLFQVGNKEGNPLCGIWLRLQKKKLDNARQQPQPKKTVDC